jgi:hypothetical protein
MMIKKKVGSCGRMFFLGPDQRKVKNLGPGLTGPRPSVFFTDIQHPVCT